MSEIRIPAAALEAGARAIADSLRTARLTLESEDGYKPEARACFIAMIEAWPGMRTEHPLVEWTGNIILPLTQEITLNAQNINALAVKSAGEEITLTEQENSDE